MFVLMFGVPWLVVAARYIAPLPWHWIPKVLLVLLLLAASQYHTFSRLSSGSVFSPEFARPLVIAFNVALVTILLLAILQIVLDVASAISAPFTQKWPRIPVGVRYGMGALALCIASFGVSQAIRVPPVRNIEIAIKDLPPSFAGYRLIQLTDLHLSRLFTEEWAREVVSRTNELGADVIVITGDLIDGSVEDRRQDIRPLADLRAKDGVFAIPGNHEYYFSYGEWIRHDEGLGMTMLENEHAVITRNDQRIVIAGVTDLSSVRHGLPAPDVRVALEGAPADAPVILLDHQPKMAADAAPHGVDLQLSGHTHGGMAVGLEHLVANANNGFVSGLYRIGDMQLYVNNGTGLWPGFAFRFGKPSELTVITLREG